MDRTQSALDACQSKLATDRLMTFCGDVTEEATAVAYTQATVDKWGQVDIVVLNAGIEGAWHMLHETPIEEYDKVMAVNARGVFIGLKHALGAFLRSPSGGKGCSAIVMCSVAGLEGVPLISPYTASKFAVRGLACIASQEYGKYGIRVNAICPGFIETPFSAAHPELLQVAKDKSSMQTLGKPSDIADAALFLASDASGFCTGSTLKVDGGVARFC